jgi:hypothetical protein
MQYPLTFAEQRTPEETVWPSPYVTPLKEHVWQAVVTPSQVTEPVAPSTAEQTLPVQVKVVRVPHRAEQVARD